MEGFYVPGSKPSRFNNPGDLRHAPGMSHDGLGPNDVGFFKTPEEGWAALERQLGLYAARGYTLEQLVSAYAPPSENDTTRYLDFICSGLGLPPSATVLSALKL